ncbi:hypothetical protein [Variovorax sp. JS1663]|uniref:hypothetical protein n=1 Tax=Variovorax sp. JS1663 TaxID=1851577 RepID=UPI000B3492C6|nr:hypothetical protein [Variovorax sp. JS1663]OUM02977.1 hypothetical protein A8M77_08530 [Variovorax sp. JS1663]
MARLKTDTRVIRNTAGSLNVVGLFWSVLMRRMVVFESLVERRLFLWLEWLRIVGYKEQPRKFQLEVEGRRTEYTPDAAVTDASGEIFLIQAKPREKVQSKDFQAWLDIVGPQLLAQGYRHDVFSPEDWPEPFWENLLMLYGYVKRHIDGRHQERVLAILSERPEWSLLDAIAHVRAHSLPAGAVYREMFYRRIAFDGQKVLSKTTEISVA